ncbi:hypothetical protein VB780_05215 [Leptolyngbya sp. CCNP1308]|uniref:hypothetical protein n=1 Tax=Leptolyngbya sp. CCNP1308 TaxID=3110255 RepID=UPI002B1EF371|nr:hypothetical protein [Leptolyngbya sp. CCNP1308]MEA5447958.1 hypothetical protein [Leptolyngbya sp. CCNP1308]
MTRDELISRIGAACTVLELERLRRVAKVAYEQLEHQKRAIALQAQLDPFWADSDTPTTADPAEVMGAEPESVVYAPGQE